MTREMLGERVVASCRVGWNRVLEEGGIRMSQLGKTWREKTPVSKDTEFQEYTWEGIVN